VTAGTLRFHALNGQTVDAHTGDYVTVPPRSPHTFSNPYDEPAKFFNTYTPAFYINYFKLLATMNEAGQPMNPEANRKAMAVSLDWLEIPSSLRDARFDPVDSISPPSAWPTTRCRWTGNNSTARTNQRNETRRCSRNQAEVTKPILPSK
jgi:hypothetical protein